MSQQLPENSDSQQPDANSTQQADSSTSQNVVQGKQNRVVQGDNNKSVLGDNNTVVQGNNNWLGNTWNIFFGDQTTTPTTPVGNLARPKNERILLSAVKEEVTARLRQSLHNAVLINLGKESQPQQVTRPWDAEIKIGLKPAEPLPNTTTILSVFESEEIAGKLLILGEPGAGKSTTQLELAQELIKRAEEQPDYPVPVLFNLSSWRNDRQSLTDWLVAELQSKYGVPQKLGQDWVDNHQLLPLLDGLDELEPQLQELCVQAINQFLAGETRPLYLVVCSRNEEYSSYSTQLQLNGAIYLQSLTNNQICDYLKTINYIELWSIISNDLNLLELVKTPLLLSITVLTSQEISVEEWQHLSSTANRLQYLLAVYIGRMMKRDINNRTYLKNKSPNTRQTQMWLVWLAQQLQRESKTEFLIEELQPSLLNKEAQKRIYSLIVVLIVGLISGPILGLSAGLIYGLIVGLILGLSAGLIYGLIGGLHAMFSETIELKEKIIILESIKKKIIQNLIYGLIVGLIVGLIFVLLSGLISGLISGLVFGLVFGLLSGLTGEGLIKGEPDLVENKKNPNQGIWKSARNAVFLSLIEGLIVGLIVKLSSELKYALCAGLIYGLTFGLNYGGLPCLEHFSLRLVLYFNGYIPWNYARFLDYCTERLFLQRVGGRYRFIHKLLQDHFAEMEFKRN
ncbi:MAG: NACHT domain-containing protein [Nostoc indistinguendum CM1-VF10]|jgi:predicted NACHT family NTPase|nr:NACHT domain-containing protein [Nostoc indistinguendum CM1-VF10]